jgi:hypothetical protein
VLEVIWRLLSEGVIVGPRPIPTAVGGALVPQGPASAARTTQALCPCRIARSLLRFL